MNRHTVLLILVTWINLSLIACASAPRPTVELSEIVDNQIAEMQKSHESFVELYYDKLRDDVERFIEEKWTPTFLEQTLSGETEASQKLLKELDTSYKLLGLDASEVSFSVDSKQVTDPDVKSAIEEGIASAVRDQRARFGKTMLKYSRAAQKQINKKRAEMLEPIDEQERFVLSELRKGYTDLLRASTTIKGYLSSLAQLTEERDKVLGKLGLLDEQRKLVSYTIDANDKAVDALEKAENANKAIDDFREKMEEVQQKYNQLTH